MSDSGLPSFYASWVAEILIGEQPCTLRAWLRGHDKDVERMPRTSDFSKWKADHRALMKAEQDRLQALGYRCTVERFFRLEGTTAVLTGKPDIVAQAEGKRPLIVDCKSGKPKDTDTAQVQIYVNALPLAWHRHSWVFAGEVDYGSGRDRVLVSPESAAVIRPRLFQVLRELGKPERPRANPSPGNCKYCEIGPSACPDRWKDTEPSMALTAEF